MLTTSINKILRLAGIALAVLLATWAEAGSIQSKVYEHIRGKDLGETKYAIMIVDLTDGTELAAINVHEPMTPASNMKLITTAAALDVLQSQFKFKTDLRLVQPADWNEVSGRLPDESSLPAGPVLVIVGDGDPAFGDPKLLGRYDLTVDDLLDEWVETIQGAGVAKVDRLVIDDRIFDTSFTKESWPQDQLSAYYCAQVAGLNFHRNVIEVWPKPTQTGRTPKIELKPPAPFMVITNRAITDKPETLSVDRRANTNQLVFRGKITHRKRSPYPVTVHDPPLFFAHLLQHRLAQSGIEVNQVDRVKEGEWLPQGQTIYRNETTLYEIVQSCNSQSVNLYSESLLKRIGHHYTGTPGSWRNGASAVRRFLRERLGISAAVVAIDDGSGLSRKNRVTANIIVQLLKTMYEDDRHRLDYIESLSIAGVRGSLNKRNRFKNQLKGRVYAKTGYINGVSTLSGYVFRQATDQRPHSKELNTVAFSLLFNDIRSNVGKVKKIQDEILELIDESYTLARAGQ
ncbi:MAG: D-alanyl-D-alanine carboxypeptidase/D-alanyl-D-alanine-endopeptidase [Phycisphaeraceae bacterium]|nr:D-alanyl-D-alanine carboxypeptidase/D-alanyl-D-alanine-endopeptidase [Phycisphaeraceae bacterium]